MQRLTLAANAGQLGNEGRNTVTGPPLNQTDISVFKTFPITERQRVQLRFEAFNALNATHLANPITGLTNPNFGKITSTAGDPRILQMALKVAW